MSYGSTQRCTTEADAIQRAVARRHRPRRRRRATSSTRATRSSSRRSLPHVLTVAALAGDDRPTVLLQRERRGRPERARAERAHRRAGAAAARTSTATAQVDGFASVSGTSFSAPMVSGAVAWIRAARPSSRRTRSPERAALRRARHRRPGLRVRDGLRDPLAWPARSPARRRRRTRPSPTTTSASSTAAPSARPRTPLFRKNGRAATLSAPRPTSSRTRSTSTGSRCAPARARRSASRRRSATPTSYVSAAARRSGRRRARSRARARGRRKTDSVTSATARAGPRTYFVAVGFSRGKRLRLLNASYSAARQPLRRSAR